MTWSPGARAPWVDDANAGRLPEYRPDPGPFDAASLMADAVRRHEGDGELDPRIVEPLRTVCAGLETDARLTPLGRWATQRYLRRLLDGHLALDAHSRSDPGLASEQIVAPVFVIGAPRTGTTALHRLLAADPAHRVAEGWELLYPVPPPEPDGHDTDPRIDRAGDELAFPQTVSEGLRSIHTYSARMPKECLSAMSFAFRSEEFVSRYHVPGYVEWLRTAEMAPAYEMHHTILRVLQRRIPTRRWVLKSPVHLQSIPEVAATYPDARFVVTHREPGDVIASVSSLVATLRSAFSDAVDVEAIGRYHLELYASSLTRLVEHVETGVLPPERTVHVHHHDIVADPAAAVGQVYEGLGLERTAEARAAADAMTIAAREDGVGAHHYEAGDFGLDAEALGAPFASYRARFLGAA